LPLKMRPQQSVDYNLNARSKDAADLLDYLTTKLEKTIANKETLEEQNSCLTSELEVATVNVAEVESARATINLAYSRLKVVSDGQARKIKDLEQQLMKFSASGKIFFSNYLEKNNLLYLIFIIAEHHHPEKCCHKCHEAACPLFAMLATASVDHAPKG